MIKKLILMVTMVVILCTVIVIPVSAKNDKNHWEGEGVISNVTVSVVDNTKLYEVTFTLATETETRTFTAMVDDEITASQIMYIHDGSRYKVVLKKQQNMLMAREFILIEKFGDSYTLPSAIYYNLEAIQNDWAIKILFSDPTIAEIEAQALAFGKIHPQDTLLDIETRINALVQSLIEEWTPFSEISPNDPVRQEPPILNEPYERIEETDGTYYLVTTHIWFAVHIYSINPLNFITKLSNQPITGEWWP